MLDRIAATFDRVNELRQQSAPDDFVLQPVVRGQYVAVPDSVAATGYPRPGWPT
jgi:hypothetical protein